MPHRQSFRVSTEHMKGDVMLSSDYLFEQAVQRLQQLGLSATWYVIDHFTGFASITNRPAVTVSCLEVCLGPSHAKPDYDAYAVAQTFHPDYPNMALIFLIERHRETGTLNPDPATFSVEIDRKYSRIFLPLMHTAFNQGDPSGQGRGLLVQSYHSQMTLGDLVQASTYSWRLLLRFKRDGQLAQIAVDYYDPYSTFVANLIRPLMGLVGGDVHFIRRTEQNSVIQMPVQNPAGGYFLVGDNSTALDQGIRLAMTYLDRHYAVSAKSVQVRGL
jgi:hypothetical protein